MPAPGRDAAKAFIFDLDGTLTLPQLDFASIRAEMGITDGPILEELEALAPAQAKAARKVLEAHEEKAAITSRLQPGARELLDELRRRNIPTAILTRNSRRSLDTVIKKHHLQVNETLSREEAPVKPSPEPVLLLCRRLGTEPANTLVTGDYIFDIESANRAGAISVLLLNQNNSRFSEPADLKIGHLEEILDFPQAQPEKSP
ncbi:MAG: HAD family hydrolase [Planctomycetota bacterium]|nr:HAD family hydrolase [Planctomycetota bacterium]